MTNKINNISLNFPCLNWEWNIKYSNDYKLIDRDLFPMSTFNIFYKSVKFYKNLNNTKICDILYYFTDTNRKNNILVYPFESTKSIYFYLCLKKYKLINVNTQITIFSKNHYILDAILLYMKYTNFQYSRKDISLFLYNYHSQIKEKTLKYIQDHLLDHVMIDKPLNNNNLKHYKNRIVQSDVMIIDIIIKIADMPEFRGAYSFQTYFSFIILALYKLNLNGTLIVNTSAISNKTIFDFILYLSCHFDKTEIYETENIEFQRFDPLFFSCIFFMGFKGGIDIKNLEAINNTNYENDPEGGFLFQVTNEADKKLLLNKKLFNVSSKVYLSNIINIKESSTIYKQYKQHIKNKLMLTLFHYSDLYSLYVSKNDTNYIKKICNTSKIEAIYLAKKYNFPLLEWIDKTPTEYFNRILLSKIKNIDLSTIYDLSNVKDTISLGKFDSLKCKLCYKFVEYNKFSDLAYQYVDKIDIPSYKNIELFINSVQKKLNNRLYHQYHANINNHTVTRAWLKMYQLLYDTHFIDNLIQDKKLYTFNICEAPGNFISSFQYYIKRNTNITDFRWVAQSLAPNTAAFYDTYGFIAKTKNHWDLGPTNTGNITDVNNLIYYYEKYKNVDALISDCGSPWSAEVVANDISVFQMLYAILFPRIGGNFIIKTFIANDNKIYLSLIYIAYCIYEKIYIYKSNINFWSPEIYIVGINKKNHVENEILLFELAKKPSNEAFYPVNEISDDFIYNYVKISNNIIKNYTYIKKFFVFLVINKDIFNSNKKLITSILYQKNNEWIDKYIKRN